MHPARREKGEASLARPMALSSDLSSTLNHRGRRTTVCLPDSPGGLEALRDALLSEAFVLTKETAEHLELKRPLRVKDNDWPITVIVERASAPFALTCYMSIPWSWIVLFSLMVLLLLPMGSFAGAPVAFLLALLLIALALYKQRFDLRPSAWWQAPSRKRWGERIQTLIANSFECCCEDVASNRGSS